MKQLVVLTIAFLAIIRCNDNLHCATKILKQCATKTDKILVNISEIEEFYIDVTNLFKNIPIFNFNLIESEQKELDKINLELMSNYRLKPDFYLSNINQDFVSKIKRYKKDYSWNPRAKFIFILLPNTSFNISQFNNFIKRNFITKFVLIRDERIYGWNFNDMSLAYTLPDNNLLTLISNCSNLVPSVKRIFNEHDPYYSNFNFLNVRYFYNNNPPFAYASDWNSSEHLGIEMNVLRVLSDNLGYHLQFVNVSNATNWGNHDNGRYRYGPIAQLIKNKVDVVFGKCYFV